MGQQTVDRSENVAYNRAKLWQIILFAANNTSTNIYLVAFSFVTYFSTGILGLAAIFVSQLMGYIRIFDGIIDPSIGVLIDKTDTKFGKYRPILILGNLITALSFIFLFNIDHFGKALTMPLFIVALIIHKIGYSMQQTITKAGQTALTNDPKQRPIFNIADGVMSAILFSGSQIVVSGYLMKKHGGFTDSFFNELMWGVIIISAILGALAVVGIWEKDNKKYFGLGEEKTQKTEMKDYIKVIKGNKPLQVLSISAALIKFSAQLFGDAVVTVMLFGILFGDYALSGVISGLMVIPNVLVTTFAASVARKKGLRRAYIMCLQVGIAALAGVAGLLFVAEPGSLNLTSWGGVSLAFVVLYALGRYFASAPSGLVLTMGADISDYETSVSGRYVSGMIGTIFSFTDSIASSFAPMVVGWVLAAVGFAKEYPTAETALTSDLKLATIALFAIIPIAVLLVSLFLMKFYKLDNEEMARVQEKIHAMKAAKDNERVQDIAKNVPLSDMDYVDLSQYPVDEP
ncbi:MULTISPECIES: MFS transporter [unclassified Streptococcus]|uniref:MFS transporter n=1 Tax=unclassified Streptococcus TaxID=2608887 RepID=UPI00359DEB51